MQENHESEQQQPSSIFGRLRKFFSTVQDDADNDSKEIVSAPQPTTFRLGTLARDALLQKLAEKVKKHLDNKIPMLYSLLGEKE